ncbi:MAG TPA: nucleoside triphosphate pyrophosphatase [Microbacteriaceae bacterium]|nr:nucleoside triphosphate pyrophosphatase [Microbacteriaceae bacterium]
MRFVLASTSPARAALLRQAGIAPELRAPGVDEDALVAEREAARGAALHPAELVEVLAHAKALAVAEPLASAVTEPCLVFGGDSAFEFDGVVHGKPHTPERARERWLAHNGKTGVLWSGHALVRLSPGEPLRVVHRVASARVTFAELSEAEIDAYIDSGEPLEVAGAFTVDSLGGPFIRHVEGDPSTVVGLSLSTLRELALELDVPWTSLWRLV